VLLLHAMPRASFARASRRRVVAASFAGALCSAAIATTAIAQSGAERVALDWRAPAECPDGAWMREEIARLAGDEAAEGRSNVLQAPSIIARGEVESPGQARGPWRVVLRTTQADAQGERALEASSCRELAHAVAVVLALTLHAPQAPGDADANADTNGGRDVAEAGDASTIDDARTDTAPEAPTRVLVGGSIAGDLGTFPSPALGVSLTLGVAYRRFRFSAIGSYWPRSRGTVDAAAGGTLSLLTAGARGCYALVATRLVLAPCVGGEAGVIRASGFGVDRPRDESSAWIALFGGGMAAWHVADTWALRLELGAAFPLIRDRFVLSGVGPVNRPASAALRTEIGIDLFF
jgi:hypothetical protein